MPQDFEVFAAPYTKKVINSFRCVQVLMCSMSALPKHSFPLTSPREACCCISANAVQQLSFKVAHSVLNVPCAARRSTHPHVPIILYISGGGGLLERMAACGPDCISLDQSVDIAEGIDRIGSKFAVQVGNKMPLLLLL